MKLGFIGLGKMGGNMVLRMAEKGHRIVAYDRDPKRYAQVEKSGVVTTSSLAELVNQLESPRVIWIMITAGNPIDQVLKTLKPLLSKGDTIVDGGNSFFKDTLKRSKSLASRGIHYLDCGTSGGIEGAREGACLMIGGDREVFRRTELLFKELSRKDTYAYVGESGAGHFTKMVHNGIEYGMMAALGEGFEMLHKQQPKLNLNVHEAARIYAQGSIIEGKLTNLVEKGLQRGDFEAIAPVVPKGETEDEMEKLEKLGTMTILREARLMRVNSRKKPRYAARIVAMLRNQFGGHRLEK